jgi:hypothetical protein
LVARQREKKNKKTKILLLSCLYRKGCKLKKDEHEKAGGGDEGALARAVIAATRSRRRWPAPLTRPTRARLPFSVSLLWSSFHFFIYLSGKLR